MSAERKPRQLGLFGPLEPKRPKSARSRLPPLGPVACPDDLLACARSLPRWVRMGTSSWSFPGWAGIIYDSPRSTSQLSQQGLLAYSQHPLLRTVGVDRTFYAPVSPDVFANYCAQVPDDFRFLAKAHDAVTTAKYSKHPRYGPLAGQNNPTFLDVGYTIDEIIGPFVEGCGAKAGPLLFQFSPIDFSRKGSPAAFVDQLHQFLRRLPRGPMYAVEIRNDRVLGTAYRQALTDVGAVHCFNVHPSMRSLRYQAEALGGVFGPAVLVRWMLGRGLRYEEAVRRYQPFQSIVDPNLEAQREIVELCLQASSFQGPAFVIVNNKAEGCAPLSIFGLARQFAASELAGDFEPV